MAASRFNKDQLKAIAHNTGPAMVIAGPGSGKTTVITNRVKALIESGTARPEEILVITFTVAAASEMKSRFIKLCNNPSVTFGTFHSVFYHFLRTIPRYAGLRLAETKECIDILRRIVRKLVPDNRYTSDFYSYLLNRISVIKNTEDIASINDSFVYKVLRIYQSELMREGLIDFDDMLVLFNKCLIEDEAFRDAMRRRFRFIMIDEFQDINRVQFDAVRTLAAPLDNIFVVGDDDQSIYAFRGSDPSIMLGFKKYYPNVTYIELFTNYRSSKTIIKTASKLIAHNKERYDKRFEAVKEAGPKVAARSFRSSEDEAAFVAADIMRLPDEIKTVGILYRTHRAGMLVNRTVEAMLQDNLPKISLMTFHASKGLEFDAVYIISANEDITPSKSSGEAGLPEERRLFYVAMTRAKQFLHISDTRYIYNKTQIRSRFVREALGVKAAAGDIFRKLIDGGFGL